ncbi:MAG: class I SAM-dependent rRNA methyltransferase [Opitutales bacterium]
MNKIKIALGDELVGHPWVELSRLPDLSDSVADGQSLDLVDAAGRPLGSGVVDLKEGRKLWRRYSRLEAVDFDEAYIAAALLEALDRRGDESCQRLVSSDADYLPGLVVELFGDVLWLSLETTAAWGHLDLIAEVLKEAVNPVEIVVDAGDGPQTHSGQGLKGRWVEVDELLYRIDLLNPGKPRFSLDQREQHPLVGSLCEGRAVLDLFSHNAAFAMQALRAGASRAVAVDVEEVFAKAIGANAQRNELEVEAVAGDALEYLRTVEAGAFDAIILDPPAAYYQCQDRIEELHHLAFTRLPPGGLLATYCREESGAVFEPLVAKAAAQVGREARIFARTSQPFDFPLLLNFPESQVLRGLILQVL